MERNKWDLNVEKFREVVVTKYVEELKKDVKVELNIPFIDFRWESLYFPKNDVCFATAECGDNMIRLVTNGEIKIVDTEEDEVYTNRNLSKSEGILDELESGDFYTSERYVVENNNWFAVEFFGNPDLEFIDDVVFEATPKNIEELIDSMIEYLVHFVKNSNF